MKTRLHAASTGRHGWAVVAALGLWLSQTVGVVAQTVPAIPAKPGEAAGTVLAGQASVTLKHAYALGPIERGGQVYQVLLTDGPVPSDALAKELAPGAGQSLLRSSKLSGITLLVDSDGFLRTAVPFIGDLRGSQMLASAGKLESFAVAPAAISGKGRLGTADTMQQGWSYAASWNAAVTKP